MSSSAVTPAPSLCLDPRVGVTAGATVPYGSARFDKSAQQFLTAANAPAFRVGATFYVAVWVRFTSTGATMDVVGKGNWAGWDLIDWVLRYDPGAAAFRFIVSNGSGGITASAAVAPTVGAAYFVEGWYDGTNVRVQFNRGTSGSSAMSGTVNATTRDLSVGFMAAGGYLDGSLNSLYVSQAVPSPSDRDWLYNAGAGRTSGDVAANKPGLVPAAGAGEWWDLNHPHATRTGAFHATPLALPRLNYSGGATSPANTPTFGTAVVAQPATTLAKVVSVADQSGNGHTATTAPGTEAIIDTNAFGPGLPGFRFDGFASRLTVNAALARERGFALQCLIRLNGSRVDAMRLARVLSTRADGAGLAQFLVALGRSGNTAYGGQSPSSGWSGSGQAQYGPTAGGDIAALAAAGPAVLTVRYCPAEGLDSTPAGYSAYLNNTPLTPNTGVQAVGASPVTVTDFGWDGTGQFLDGRVGPLKVWDFAPSVADLMASAHAIGAAYGVTGFAGSDPTGSVATNNLAVCLGDSMTLGLYTTDSGVTQPDGKTYPNSYPMQLLGLLGAGWDVRNLGIGGETSDGIVTDELPTALALYRPYAARNVAVLMEMINAAISGGDSPATIYASNTRIIRKLQQNGFQVVHVSIPSYATGSPLAPPPTFPAIQAQCDALLDANTAGADVRVWPSRIPQLANPLNGTYIQDGLHYTAAGYGVLAAHVLGAIQAGATAPPANRAAASRWLPRTASRPARLPSRKPGL